MKKSFLLYTNGEIRTSNPLLHLTKNVVVLASTLLYKDNTFGLINIKFLCKFF